MRAGKNRVNQAAACSALKLNPSSDSSVESNGVRSFSARVEINQIIVGGQDGKISHRFSCVIITAESVNNTFII